ncbi:MAG: phosphatidylglycerophosphatase A [Deltaproteobacteria bacterium]|nr:phosphatidylglycerophosphatase A [Deltaproteobacteria bacterium]
MNFIFKMLATGFGFGYFPVIPGTFGTLVAIPLFLLFIPLSAPLYFLNTLVITLLAIWVSDKAIPLLAGGKKPTDPQVIVIDEVAGFLWTAGILRFAGFWDPQEGLIWLLAIAFVSFRIFDASKWWLVGWAERRFQGGMAVVMDDVIAGIFAGFASILFCVVYPMIVYLWVSLRA